MPIKNPQLSPIDVKATAPVVGDYSAALSGVGKLAESLINERKEAILTGFRGQIDAIQTQALAEASTPTQAPTRDLNAEDQNVLSEFGRHMNQIYQMTRQSPTMNARMSALIKAETALRQAQRSRPGLATEFRQEASLVLGEDPTGSQLRLMSQSQQDVQQRSLKEWDDMVKHGYEDLGMPRTILPGTKDWYINYEVFEEQWSQTNRFKNHLENLAQARLMNGDNQQEISAILSNPKSAYNVGTQLVGQGLNSITSLNPTERLQWINGERTLSIAGNDVTYPQYIASLQEVIINLDKDLALVPPTGPKEELVELYGAIKTQSQFAIDTLGDPNANFDVVNAINKLDQAIWLRDQPVTVKNTIYKTEYIAPYLKLLSESDFAKNNMVRFNELIDSIVPLFGFNVQPGENGSNNSLYAQRVSFDARTKHSGTTNAVELTVQDHLKQVSDALNLFGNSEVPMPKEAANSFVSHVTSMIDYANTMRTDRTELTEQILELLPKPEFAQIIETTGNNIQSQYRESIINFYNKKTPTLRETIRRDVLGTRTTNMIVGTGANRQNISVEARDAFIPTLMADGKVELMWNPEINDISKRALLNKKKEWEEAFTRRVKSQATINMLIDSGKINYAKAFLSYQPYFGFTQQGVIDETAF